MLVGLAASAAMIQASLLLPVSGKTPASFAVMDLMRLPLGILTGVGFIGGGVILKQGDMVRGVTTAATLWIVTMIGLCFGGGQIGLGSLTTLLVLCTLMGLFWIDVRLPRQHRASLVLLAKSDLWSVADVKKRLEPSGWNARFLGHRRVSDEAFELTFQVQWKRAEIAETPLSALRALSPAYVVESFNLTGEPDH